MRVLVTRAEPEATATAARLQALGHVPEVAPTAQVEAVAVSLPLGPFDDVLVTSANAIRHLPADVVAALADVPVSVVGARSRAAARSAGLGPVLRVAASAADLLHHIAAEGGGGRRFLYLAGAPRKPDLERGLIAAGHQISVCETYVVVDHAAFPPAICAALAGGGIEAVLHYSREGAARFVRLARGCGGLAPSIRHLCLSADVALGLSGIPNLDIRVAAQPDEDALLALLKLPR